MTTKDANPIIRWRIRAVTALLLATSIAHASPEGGDVVEGEADITYGDWTRVLTGEITIIDWLSFNIAAGETVEFIMPGADSRVLNRITNGTPTEIMGNLIGNGQIFIVNPAGVIFGQGAVVNVGALYAAAGNISNTDFMNGTYRFTDARGIVENRGHLEGDLIALVGGRVANHGTISAPNGTVVMAAGEQVLIGEFLGHTFVHLERPSDLDNTPTLNTEDGPALAAGDVYSLAAWNTGTIDAENTTVAISAGHMAINSDITAGELSLIAENDAHIQLGANLHADGAGLLIDGDLILTDDVQVTTDGSDIIFKGRVDSESDASHDLVINAENGVVRFTEHVGTTNRLGTLQVEAALLRLYGDVSIADQLNLYTPVSISGLSTTFDVGMGSALFAGDLYSSTNGRSDIAFLYDGQAWVGQGEARAPYQFHAGIGVNPGSAGAFRTITLGGDLNDPARSSAFVFATGATPGHDLIDANTDLGYIFNINATESIIMGQGQRLTSFGSLNMTTSGDAYTTIAVGDLNVLGDLRIASQGRSGGQIIFNSRAPGQVDWYGNEDDRSQDALTDEGLELIASGDITLIGDLGADGPVRLGSGGSVQLLNNSGTGNTGPLDIEVFEGGVSLDLFASMLPDGALYPYDLTAIPQTPTPNTEANLARALDGELPLSLRTDDPLLAAREVLTELGATITDPSDEAYLDATSSGTERYINANAGLGTTDDAADFGVTIDRLNRSSVERLTWAYTDLLGQRVNDQGQRERDKAVQNAIFYLSLNDSSTIQSVEEFINTHAESNTEIVSDLAGILRVLKAIDLLELTPLEITKMKRNLINRISPDSVTPGAVYERWFAPKPNRFAIDAD